MTTTATSPRADHHRRRFSKLALDHRSRLYGYLRALGAHPDVAEDCLQEALVRAYRSRASLADWDKAAPWLYAIARHVFLDEMRRREVRSRPLPPRDAAAEEVAVSERLEAAQRAQAIRAAVARLKPPRPELIELHYSAGLTMEEIGEVTGLPVGTVKTHLHRARAELRRLLTEDEETIHG